MNKTAELGPIGVVLMFMIFGIMFLMVFGGWMNQTAKAGVDASGLKGVEAFFFSNPAVWVILIAILGLMGYLYFGAK